MGFSRWHSLYELQPVTCCTCLGPGWCFPFRLLQQLPNWPFSSGVTLLLVVSQRGNSKRVTHLLKPSWGAPLPSSNNPSGTRVSCGLPLAGSTRPHHTLCPQGGHTAWPEAPLRQSDPSPLIPARPSLKRFHHCQGQGRRLGNCSQCAAEQLLFSNGSSMPL